MPFGIPAFGSEPWESFKERMPAFVETFRGCSKEEQRRTVELIHRFAAGRLLLIAANTRDVAAARAIYKTQAGLENQDFEAGLRSREELMSRFAEELQLVMQLYWIYYDKALVMPGPEDDPIMRLLPPPVVHRHRARRREPANRPDAPEPAGQGDLAFPLPQVALGEVAVAGLIEIQPGDPILNHPHVIFYISQGAKRFYRTRFLGRFDCLLTVLEGRSGALVIGLISLERGHTADHFLRAGMPTDPREALLRWVPLAQLTRSNLAGQPRGEVYLGWIRHNEAPPGPPRLRPDPCVQRQRRRGRELLQPRPNGTFLA